MKKMIFGAMLGLAGLMAVVTPSEGALTNYTVGFTAVLPNHTFVDIGTRVIENPVVRGGKTVLLLHGLVHTANAMVPLGTAIVSNPGNAVRRVLIPDLPGRGLSGFPYGNPAVLFGSLDLEDYSAIMTEALIAYRLHNLVPSMIVAHSMGGLIVQKEEDCLERLGLSLSDLGITKITTIGSSSPAQVPDPSIEDGGLLGLVQTYFTFEDPALGTFSTVDPESFLGFFFLDTTGNFPVNVPSPEDVGNQGYIGLEPFPVVQNVVGPSTLRPSVKRNVFAYGGSIALRVLIGEQDSLGNADQQKALYLYLTGDSRYRRFAVIPGTDTVHDVIISDPTEVVPFLGL